MVKIYNVLLRSFLVIMVLLCGVKGWGQVVISTQDFETVPVTPTLTFTNTLGLFSTGNNGAGRPANANLFVSGARGWQVLSATSALTFANQTLSGYSDCFIDFRLAGMNANTTGNGIDIADVVTVAISVDGGTTYSNEITIGGSAANQYWDFTAIGTATITYDGNNSPTAITSSTGSGGITSVKINIPNVNSQVRARITMLNNSADERWVIDDVRIMGTVATPSSVAISNGSVAASNVNQGALNVILQQYNLAVTDANATLNGLTIPTAGTYIAADLINLKVRYSADATLDGGDATLCTKTTGLGAGSQVLTPFTSQVINNGNTGYVFITADISPTATAGATINVDPTTFANISFAGTVNKTGTDPVAAGGVKTFVAVTPDVVLSSPSPAVPAGNILQNTDNNIVYRFDLAVTTANVTLNGVTINTSGTNIAADVDQFKCWYSADAVFNAGTDQLLSTKSASNQAGEQVFTPFTSQVITNGTTGYIFITAKLPCAATSGNTIIADAITTANISFVSANESGTANAGGTQTITTATPANVTGAAASNLNISSAVSWTNPTGCYDELMIVARQGVVNDGVPTGDGSTYTANLSFGTGTALGNGFVVYKGNTSPQTVTNLTNGSTYHFKIFTRNDLVWSAGVEVTATPVAQIMVGEIVINQFSPDYGGASDEYVELVNTTDKTLDLSTLKLSYGLADGTPSGSTTLSGSLAPHSFWLLSPNAVITVGQTVSLSRDGSFTAGFAATNRQIAILRVSDDFKIDGLGYGTLTGGTYVEGTAAANPPADGGLRRVLDGADANNNVTDFTTVTQANIYLRNSSSRMANAGAVIAAGTYENVSVTGNSSIAGNITLTKRLALNAGALNIGSNTLTTNNAVSGTGTLSGSATSNLTINGAAGTISFTGGANTLKNLLLNTGATATLGNALNFTGGTAPATEGTVIVNTGATLTTGGFLTLKSNAFGTARVGTSAGTISGNATVERYINANIVGRKWHMISGRSTNSSQTVVQSWQEGGGAPATPNVGTWVTSNLYSVSNGFDETSLNSSILKHNPAVPSWVGQTATNTGTVSDEQGYMIFVRGDRFANSSNALQAETVLRTTGTLRQGTQTAVTIPNANPGHTMVGNPFASPIDLENILTATNMGQFFYVWDASAAGTFGVGIFRLVQKTGAGTYTSTPTTGSDNTMRYIHSGQAFLLKTDLLGDASFVATEADKASLLSIVNPLVPVPGDQQLYTELVTVNPGNIEAVADAVRVWYNPGFSAGTTDDILKVGNFKENISSHRNGIKLIVEMRPMITATDTIFLRSGNLEVRDYRFKINTFDFVQTNFVAMLEDSWLNNSTPLNLGGAVTNIDFSVTSNPASANPDRFRIVFDAAGGPLPVTITSIKAAQQGSQVAVEWKATNQVNMKQYEVEKSTDGINYIKVNTPVLPPAFGSLADNSFLRCPSVRATGSVPQPTTATASTEPTVARSSARVQTPWCEAAPRAENPRFTKR